MPILLFIGLWAIPFAILLKDFLRFEDLSIVLDAKFLKILWFTLYQAAGSTAIAFGIALLPAYYLYRKRNALSALLESAVFIPFFLPPVSTVIAFSLLFSANGLFARLGLQLPILYTVWAILIAHAFYNSPIFVKYIGTALRAIPPALEETAISEGAGRFARFWWIEGPLVFPAIAKAFFLSFTYSFMSFAVVLNLGGLRFTTLEVAIANALRGQFDFSRALVYAIAQFVCLFILNALLTLVPDTSTGSPTLTLSRTRPSPITTIGSFLYAAFEYGLVLIGLLGFCYDFWNRTFSFEPIARLFSPEFNRRFPVVRSLFNSFAVASVAAIGSVTAAFLFGKAREKWAQRVIMPTLGVSSAFLAMSLLYLHILFGLPFFPLLTAGYFLSTLAVAYAFMRPMVRNFPANLVESAKIDGASRFRIFRSIEWPLLFPVFAAVFFQVFAIVFGEFTLPYTMQIRDYFPLASVVNYAMNAQRYYREGAAFSALNIGIVFFLFLVSNDIIQKRRLT